MSRAAAPVVEAEGAAGGGGQERFIGESRNVESFQVDELGEEEEPPILGNVAISKRLSPILILIAITIVQYGVIGTVTAYVANSFFAGDGSDCEKTPDSKSCREGAAQYAYWSSMASGISACVSWAISLSIGSISDKVGRSPFLRAKVILSLLPPGFLYLYLTRGLTLYVWLILFQIYSLFDIGPVWLAIQADLVREKNSRAKAFSVILIYTIIMALLVTPFAGLLPAQIAVIVSIVFAVLKVLYVVVYFPETSKRHSGTEEEQAAVRAQVRDDSWLSIFNTAKTVFSRSFFFRRMVLVLVSSGISTTGLGVIMSPILLGYLGLERRELTLGWTVAGLSILVSLGMIGPFTRCVGGDVKALRILLFYSAAFPLLLLFIKKSQVMIFFIACGPLLVQYPLVSAIKANVVNDDEQGLVQGILAAVRTLAFVFSDFFFGWFFKFATDAGKRERESTALPIFMVTALSLIAFLTTLTLPSTVPKPESTTLASPVSVEDAA